LEIVDVDKTIKERITVFVNKLRVKGFFGIFFGSIVVKIMTFASALFLPRVFSSKTEYGILTDVDNIRSYFLLFNAMGISNAIIKYCVKTEHSNVSSRNFKFIIRFGLMVDMIMMVIYVFVCWKHQFNYENERHYLYISTFWLLLAFMLETMQLFLRAQFKNNWYVISSFAYAALMCILQIGMGYIWGIEGVLIGRYIAIGISVLITYWFVHQCYENQTGYPDKILRHQMLRFGVICMLGNVSSLIMQSNEKKILSDTLCDAQVLANYQVSSTIINILLFVINAVIIFVSPYFSAHKDDFIWCYKMYHKIMKINYIIMIPLHLIVFLLAKYIVLILYGTQYLDSLGIMRIMIIASLCQSLFRALPGSILPLLGFEKFNLYVNLIFVVVHYILARLSIGILGANGAAIALTVVYFLSGIVYMVKMRFEYRKIAKQPV
jgi:O-antigen/teichoic acid export membrane protein